MKEIKFLIILSILLLGITGCSKGSSNPVSDDNFNVPTTDLSDVNSVLGVLGTFSLSITDSLTADLSTTRKLSLGESFVISGEAFFAIAPCRDCLRINSVGLDADNNIIAELALKHPFPKGDTNEDPSSTNRLDLDIFDVALFVKPENQTPANFELTNTDIYSDIILNADGYSKELQNLTGDNAALPYNICYKSSDNNRFEMGTTWQYFDVIVASAGLDFDLYLTMGYGASARLPQRLDPVYFVPEFNRKSAWKIEVEANPWFQDNPNTVTIDIFDWNHGVTVAENYPDPDNTNHISAPSDISSVTVEVPGMTDNIIVAETTDTQTNGWNDPISYTATFTNENQLPIGDYTGLVKVVDSREPGIVLVGSEIDTLAHSIGGTELEWQNIPEFATYQTFKASVVDNICGPISGEIISPLCPIDDVYNGEIIDFTVTALSAYGGDPVTLYELDWDYDGSNFDVDASNTDGIFYGVGPFDNPNCGGSNDPVTYTVAFRATDSCDPPNRTIFETCEVTVEYCCGPITGEIISPACPVTDAIHRQMLDFVVSASSAAGGDPVYFYEVDLDYDGVIFDRDDSNGDGVFNNLGPFINPNCGGSEEPVTYTVAFRGSDTCNPTNITVFATCEVTVICGAGWARTWGGEKRDSCSNIAFDNFGNLYVVGSFMETVDFDPGNGEDWHFAFECGSYISKFNIRGDFIWARTWDNNYGGLDVIDLGIDDAGNIFITGGFRGTVDFDPGPGTDWRTSPGISRSPDTYICKYDINGNYLKVITFGGENQDHGLAISVSDSGAVYTTGFISGPVDFDPGPGVVIHNGTTYLCRYDSGLNLVWAWALGDGFPSIAVGNDVLIDNSENVFWTGFYAGSVDFDPGPGVDIHNQLGSGSINMTAFLGKFDSDGNYQWTRSWGQAMSNSVTINDAGNIFCTGPFSGTVDFDPGSGISQVTAIDETDAFMSSFDNNGNFTWVRTWGGADNASSSALYSDTVGNIYVSGSFWGITDFDPGPGVDEIESRGENDGYLSRFDQNGNYHWVRTWGTEDHEYSNAVISDDLGNVYVTGAFSNTIDFDPGANEDSHTSLGGRDAFLTKLLPNGYWE